MITVDQAFELVASHVAALTPTRVRLRDSLGLVLSADVTSDTDSPPYNKAMMDGYAVASSDDTTERKVVERIMAGDIPRHAIRPGIVAQVMTGAPVPDGTSAVIPVEQTRELGGDIVRFDTVSLPAGKHVQPQGTLMLAGKPVVRAGSVVTPRALGAMAEAGAAVVEVVPRPTVSILTTGNELVSVDQHPGPGQIRDSNGPMLTAAVTLQQAEAEVLPSGGDDLETLTQLATEGLVTDILLVTGGVSAGVKDLVPEALEAAGVEPVFHKVALKPGRPLWFGIAPREAQPPRLVFGLPGNPVSGLVCFHLFVRPALAVLSGRAAEFQLPWRQGHLASDFSYPAGRETLRPATMDSTGRVEMCPWQGSADLAGMVGANCLVRLPGEGAELAAGTEVQTLLI